VSLRWRKYRRSITATPIDICLPTYLPTHLHPAPTNQAGTKSNAETHFLRSTGKQWSSSRSPGRHVARCDSCQGVTVSGPFCRQPNSTLAPRLPHWRHPGSRVYEFVEYCW
jgi:hypothetical protein